VPPPSAMCRTRSEMLIGTSSLVIECIGDSLTHRDYEPGYPPVRVAGFMSKWMGFVNTCRLMIHFLGNTNGLVTLSAEFHEGSGLSL
jgi:hypothetical protein